MDQIGVTASADAQPPDAPAEFVDLPPETAQWPMGLGWVLTGYGILGIGANLCGAVSLHWYAPVMKWALGAEIPGPPLPLTIATSATSFAGIALGIVLVRGAWRMRQRRMSGLRLVQRWVMLRIALAVVGLAVGLLMLKNNVQWSSEVEEAIVQAERRRAEQSVSGPPPGMGGGGGRRGRGGMRMGGGGGGSGGPPPMASAPARGPAYYGMQIGSVAISAAAVSAMPLFAGFYLTSRRRRDEWERWSD
jgi:hypothetical protein